MDRDAWLAVLGSMIGGGVACAAAACADAPPAPAVTAREVTPWSSAPPPPVDAPVAPDAAAATSPSPSAAPLASAPASAPPAPPPAPPRPLGTPLSSYVARTVATPAQPGPAPKGPKKGSLEDILGQPSTITDLERMAQASCGASANDGSLRLGRIGGGGPAPGPWIQLTPDIGLSPRPGLDDDAKARATAALRVLRRVVSSCVTGDKSGVISVALSTAGAGDGVHAILSAPGLPGDVTGCLRPHLEEHGLFGGDAGPQKLTFRIGVKAGWAGGGSGM